MSSIIKGISQEFNTNVTTQETSGTDMVKSNTGQSNYKSISESASMKEGEVVKGPWAGSTTTIENVPKGFIVQHPRLIYLYYNPKTQEVYNAGSGDIHKDLGNEFYWYRSGGQYEWPKGPKTKISADDMRDFLGKTNFSVGFNDDDLKETLINELSPETYAKYKKTASADASAADEAGNFKRGDKRFRGINRATRLQFKQDAKKVEEEQAPMFTPEEKMTVSQVKSELDDAYKAIMSSLQDMWQRRPDLEPKNDEQFLNQAIMYGVRRLGFDSAASESLATALIPYWHDYSWSKSNSNFKESSIMKGLQKEEFGKDSFKSKIQNIIKQSPKGSAAEKAALQGFMRTKMFPGIEADSDDWIESAIKYLEVNQVFLKNHFPELDLTNLRDLAEKMYEDYLASFGRLEEKRRIIIKGIQLSENEQLKKTYDLISKIWNVENQKILQDQGRYLVYSPIIGLEFDTDNYEDAEFTAKTIAAKNRDSSVIVYDRKTKFPVIVYLGNKDLEQKNRLHDSVDQKSKVKEILNRKNKT